MNRELFTFILDYKGGTYISQVRSTLGDACEEWIRGLAEPELNNHKPELITEVQSQTPTPIDGLLNIWCVSALLQGELALVHIVKTAV
jgi:hypothetical protein